MNPSDIERWNERFNTPDFLFGKAPNAFLASKEHMLRPGARALVLADGEGRNGVWLAEQGLEVLSVDASSVAQEKARALAAERGVHVSFEQADLATWEMGHERFDLVAAIFIQCKCSPLGLCLSEGTVRWRVGRAPAGRGGRPGKHRSGSRVRCAAASAGS